MRYYAYLIALSVLSSMALICTGHNVGYTIAANDHLNYYHYPTPRGAQLHETSTQHHYETIEQYYQQQKQQQQHHNHHHHHRQHPSTTVTVAKEFASPMLENAAFTMALTRQGYFMVDATMSPSAMITSIGIQQHSPIGSQTNSQNVKLPLPLGITPITFAPLPLQAGAPYSTVRGLTSYGTPYPQRRR